MPVQNTLPTDAEGFFRFSGMYGEAYRDGKKQADVTEVSGTIEVNRIDVNVPGSDKTVYKRGRRTRTGTLRFQKIDSHWEHEMLDVIGRSLDQRRADRDAGNFNPGVFDLQVRYDDPDALGVESMMLFNCQVWQVQVGFAQGDDLVERELPLTWEHEEWVSAFTADLSGNAPRPAYFEGLGPKSAVV